jgi:hypothetical protein
MIILERLFREKVLTECKCLTMGPVGERLLYTQQQKFWCHGDRGGEKSLEQLSNYQLSKIDHTAFVLLKF